MKRRFMDRMFSHNPLVLHHKVSFVLLAQLPKKL
ncbi:hypothetical protein PSHT_05186 [Puccinia striiformis]|uniref:Uncharacterized protein n=1 Tax=Puccinia striiformis TaxID=27350 RepID=A0A2S4WBB5_9BASI|nr:hypothetical protein PSHT_05186 [Puccinia striiformis]